jgi:hypothetical protein
MPSDAYALIWQAVRERQPLTFRYGDHRREVCPLILGYAADGQERLSAYQFAGGTSGKKKLPEWRCFDLTKMSEITTRPGPWLEGDSHTQAQSCVRYVDVDANIPDTLTRKAPLRFGAPELQPPRRSA